MTFLLLGVVSYPYSTHSCKVYIKLVSLYTYCQFDNSVDKESVCNEGDLGLIPGLGRSPGEGKGYPLQYSGLEDSVDYIVYGVPESWT